jgi:hypothetical protein
VEDEREDSAPQLDVNSIKNSADGKLSLAANELFIFHKIFITIISLSRVSDFRFSESECLQIANNNHNKVQ